MIRTRVAPSPTGNMHIGTARVSLFNYILAKQKNGKFLIRIEDTDKERSLDVHTKEIIKGLEWLGLKYDEEIVYQSKNEGKHIDVIKYFLDNNYAYFAYETSEELQEIKKQASDNKQNFVYRQRHYTQKEKENFKKQGRKPVVRFKVPNKKIIVKDMIKGDIEFDMSLVSDFVIQKSNQDPIFYIANVVDDNLMGITNVIRGEDHLSNTPKQILLYEALGYNVPEFGHLPLLLNANKSKMSKRDTKEVFVTVKRFFQEGFLKQAVLNFIALLGWHTSDDREFFYMEDLIKEFDINKIQSSNAIYDFQRAIFFNGEHIRNLSDEQFIYEIKNYVYNLLFDPIFKSEDEELIEKLKYWQNLIEQGKLDDSEYNNKWVKEIKVRLQTLKQFVMHNSYLFDYIKVPSEILFNQKMKVSKDIVKEYLPNVVEEMEKISERTEDNLKELLINYNKINGLKNGQTLRPIRSILSGVQASPGAFELLLILGKEESISRLKKALGEI